MEQTGHIFISHASQDDNIADRVYMALQASGIDAWLDHVVIQAGDNWDKAN